MSSWPCPACHAGSAAAEGALCPGCGTLAGTLRALSEPELVDRGRTRRHALTPAARYLYDAELARRGVPPGREKELALVEKAWRSKTTFGDAEELVESVLFEGERITHVARCASPWRALRESRGCFDEGCLLTLALIAGLALVAPILGAIRRPGPRTATGAGMEEGVAVTVGLLLVLLPFLARLRRALHLLGRRYVVTTRRVLIVAPRGFVTPTLGIDASMERAGATVRSGPSRGTRGRFVELSVEGLHQALVLERVADPEELARALAEPIA